MKKYLKIISKNHYFKVSLLTIFIIIAGFLEMIGIGSIVLFVNSVFNESSNYLEYLNNFINLDISTNYLTPSVIGFFLLVIFIIKNLFILIVKIFEHFVTYKIKVDNNKKIFNFYLQSSFLDHKDFKSSELTRNIVTDNSQAASYIQNQIIIIRELFIALVIFMFLVFNDTLMILSIFGFLYLISFFFISLIKKKLTSYGKIIFEARSKILETVNNLFLGIKDIKLLKIENSIENKFLKNDKDAQKSQFYYDIYQSAPRLFIEIMVVLIIFIIALKFNMIDNKSNNLATSLSLLGASFIRLLPAFSAITTAISKNKFLRPSFEIIYKEINKSENYLIKKKEGKNIEIDFFEKISIKNLDYRFPKQTKNLFENLDLEIVKGDIFCVSGESGQGKTTLCDLIVNLLKPTKGKILINKLDISNLSPKSFKKMISFVTQKPFFNEGLIIDSLYYGIKDKGNTGEENQFLINIIKLVCLDELIDKKKNSLNQIQVSELSGGQLQRLALARAIIKKPQLLILDEATNALDLELEMKVIQNIKLYLVNITIILISHRNETKDYANKIYDIKSKKFLKYESNNF